MKKKYLGLVALLSLLSVFAIWGQSVRADVDYDIDNVRAIARVNKDGSLTMHRTIKYSFDSDARGVYYKQNLAVKQKLSNIQVKVDGQNIKAATTGKNNTYKLQKQGNSYNFKVYHRIKENDKVKVEYSYLIHRAITNYLDTAELNFKIVGNGWDTDLDHVRAEVIFPGAVKGLKAWAHGPLSGYTQVLPKEGKIIMTADDVAGDSGVEVHAIFPTTVTSANQNIVKENKKRAIEKQEAALAKEANQKRQRKQMLSIGLIIISVLVGFVVVIRGFFIKKVGVKPKIERDLVHNYEIPDISPTTAQILDKADKPNVKAFAAYLMQLAGKNKIKIEKYQTKHLKRSNYRITLVDDSVLTDDLLDFIFNKVGDGKSFTTKDLRDYTSKKLGRRFDKWCDGQYKQVEDKDLLDKKYRKQRSNFRTGMLMGMIASFAIWVISLMMANNIPSFVIIIGIMMIVLEVVAFIVGNSRLSIYTQKGALETDQVRGFKKMLDDIGQFKMKDVGDLILWEDIMPYAVAFGLSKKVLKQLKIEFADELDAAPVLFYSGFYSSSSDSFEHSFERSFSSAVSTGSSSVSGSSGGFSGGSSGGFGGGSGGGAF